MTALRVSESFPGLRDPRALESAVRRDRHRRC